MASKKPDSPATHYSMNDMFPGDIKPPHVQSHSKHLLKIMPLFQVADMMLFHFDLNCIEQIKLFACPYI